MNEEEKQALEILNEIKMYMQENIDNGFHKFIWNIELGYDEKCIDVINAINEVKEILEKQQKEIEKCEYYKDHADLFLEENKKLKKEIEGLKEKSYYLPASCNPNYISKDKIKEFVENEYEWWMDEYNKTDVEWQDKLHEIHGRLSELYRIKNFLEKGE